MPFKGNTKFTKYQKSLAHKAVSRAIRLKKLKKENCEVCGTNIKIEGHHYKGYAPENWLKVQWLCQPHHRQVELQIDVLPKEADLKLIGKAKGLTIKVKILEVRQAFNRIEYLVTPMGGWGKAWKSDTFLSKFKY